MKDKVELRQILLEKWQYKESQADGMVEKLLAMDPAILAAFEGYLESGELPEAPAYGGIHPQNLGAAYPLKPPAVFTLLDWIRREPRRALNALYMEYRRLPEKK